MKNPITTHVLDISRGKPAQGIAVILEMKDKSGEWKELVRGITDGDGRVTNLLPEEHKLVNGSYRLTFNTESYFVSQGIESLFLSVMIPFVIKKPLEHYHIPLLLSPFGYSTYRGS